MYVATIQSNEIFSGSYRQKPIPSENVFSKKILEEKEEIIFSDRKLGGYIVSQSYTTENVKGVLQAEVWKLRSTQRN